MKPIIVGTDFSQCSYLALELAVDVANKLHTDITAAKEQGLTAEDMVFYPIPSLETDLNPYIE